ncbi:hypothetical protein RINTHH_12660 [Richelia intracellularis HH01]|uniref:Uncharacterized protein n=1 Tax=Richelia intracellularis HH01 TaxID=1165094 RepID=M1X5K5_9NOST|nr:hypothetical protein RINTHH_12660 [Richelia intracellularis HH01]
MNVCTYLSNPTLFLKIKLGCYFIISIYTRVAFATSGGELLKT